MSTNNFSEADPWGIPTDPAESSEQPLTDTEPATSDEGDAEAADASPDSTEEPIGGADADARDGGDSVPDSAEEAEPVDEHEGSADDPAADEGAGGPGDDDEAALEESDHTDGPDDTAGWGDTDDAHTDDAHPDDAHPDDAHPDDGAPSSGDADVDPQDVPIDDSALADLTAALAGDVDSTEASWALGPDEIDETSTAEADLTDLTDPTSDDAGELSGQPEENVPEPSSEESPLGDLLAGAMSGLRAAHVTDADPDTGEDTADDGSDSATGAEDAGERRGFGLSRMLAAAQSVFGDGNETEETPTLATEDLPEELPSWAVTEPSTPADQSQATGPEQRPADHDRPHDDEPSVHVTEQDEADAEVPPDTEVAEDAHADPFPSDELPGDAPDPGELADALSKLGGVEPLDTPSEDATDDDGQSHTDDGEGSPLDLGADSPIISFGAADSVPEAEDDLGWAQDWDRDDRQDDDPNGHDLTAPVATTPDLAEGVDEPLSADQSGRHEGALGDEGDDAFQALVDPGGPEDERPGVAGSQGSTPDGDIDDHDTPEDEAADADWPFADGPLEDGPLEDGPLGDEGPADTESDDEATDADGSPDTWAAEDTDVPATGQDPWGDPEDGETLTDQGIDRPISSITPPAVYAELSELPPGSSDEPDLGFHLAASTLGGDAWGEHWDESAQGWIEAEDGATVWRPIVTTAPTLSSWAIETYLGVVTGDVTVGAMDPVGGLGSAREEALEAAVAEAMGRGAHAVTGVQFGVHQIGGATVVTATGTAVTLKAG